MKLPAPLCLLGVCVDGKKVLGGAFQLADTFGLPLSFSMTLARERGFEMSLPHYFASAIEHGWTYEQTSDHIREALSELGKAVDFDWVMQVCASMFITTRDKINDYSPKKIAAAMRLELEMPYVVK